MPSDDRELLAAFSQHRDADAFAQIMARHIDFVYASALRQTPDAQSAQDVTQAVFLLLWQRGANLKRGTILKGWLFNATRYVAANARRAEARRKAHEREAAAMRLESIQPKPMPEFSPHLDDAMASLSERDRQAILLRYFQDEPLAIVGEQMGVSEDAAKKRVTRAVARLQRFLSKRGVNAASAALPGLLVSQAIASTPPQLLQTTLHLILSGVHGAAAAGSAIPLAKGAAKMMFRNQLKLVAAKCLLATACVTAATATVVTEVQRPTAKPQVTTLAMDTTSPTADSSSTATEDPEFQACRGVLLGVIDGYEHDDAKKIESLLYWDPATPQETIDDLNLTLAVDVATYRIEKSAITHFGSQGAGLFLRTMTIMACDVDILSRINPDNVQVMDDEVAITPSETLPGLWPSKPIYFRQVGNDWQLDAGKTFRVVHKSVRRHPIAGETEEQTFAVWSADVTNRWNSIADDIDHGKIKDVIETQARINAAYMELSKIYIAMGCEVTPK